MLMPDIYFEPSWGELNSQLEEGDYCNYEFENEKGKIYYHFIKKPVPIKIDSIQYYDTVTPYGYNGPIVMEYKEENFKNLIEDWNKNFSDYCKEHNIIAEYVKFNPWLKNHEKFKNIYNIIPKNYTLGIDLSGDFFKDEFSSKCRNQVRKAIKSNVIIEFDFIGENINEFYRLYNLMAERNNISEFYRFKKKYFIDIFEKLKNSVFIINASYDDEIISSAIFLNYGDYLHYLFSGNNAEFNGLCANNLILFSAATWAKENGKKLLHLGAGSTESLIKFKRTFTKTGIFNNYVGTKIRNREIYYKLIDKKGEVNRSFFPEYR